MCYVITSFLATQQFLEVLIRGKIDGMSRTRSISCCVYSTHGATYTLSSEYANQSIEHVTVVGSRIWNESLHPRLKPITKTEHTGMLMKYQCKRH